MTNSENLQDCRLDEAVLQRLLAEQHECTFTWVNRAGQPFGAIMSYFFRDGSFWLTSAEKRARVAAVRRNAYAAITISSMGTSLGTGKTASYRGPCLVHDDRATLDWMLPELAKALRPESEEGAAAMLEHLDTPNRIVLQLTAEFQLDFDSRKMWIHRPDAAPPGRL
jgi:general stress protein 26